MWNARVNSKSFGLASSYSSFLNKDQQKRYKQLTGDVWNILRSSGDGHVGKGSSVVWWKEDGGASRCWGSTACDCVTSPCWVSGSMAVALVRLACPLSAVGWRWRQITSCFVGRVQTLAFLWQDPVAVYRNGQGGAKPSVVDSLLTCGFGVT